MIYRTHLSKGEFILDNNQLFKRVINPQQRIQFHIFFWVASVNTDWILLLFPGRFAISLDSNWVV